METARPMTSPALRLVPIVLLLALASGCERVLDLRVALVTSGCDGDPLLSPMAGVSLLRFSVYGDGLRASDYEMTATPAEGRVELPQVPAGKNRILVVEGLAAQGTQILSLGMTGPLDLTVAQSSLDVTVFLRRTGAFSQTTAQDTPGTCTQMNTPRANHAVAELEDGRVLITGGVSLAPGGGPQYLSSTEIYDPKTGRFVSGPPLSLERAHHTATHIPGTSITLIAGGRKGDSVLRIAEVFDESIPPNGGFLQPVQMRVGRRNHAAALLGAASGRVVLVGGYTDTTSDTTTGSIEVFDVRQNRFEDGGALPGGRGEAAAVTVGDLVYVVGGFSGAEALQGTVVLSPRVNGSGLNVAAETTLSLSVGRIAPLVAPIGQLLIVAGGASAPDPARPGQPFRNALSSVDGLDVTSPGSRLPPGDPSLARRVFGGAAALRNRTVLIAGGASINDAGLTVHKNAEIHYVDQAGKLKALPTNMPMRTARERLRLTSLRDGTVLVTGGVDADGATLNTAEIFQPTYSPTPSGPFE